MAVFSGFVDLAEARLVAKGTVRLVYEHDDFPGMLIKVIMAELIDERGQARRRSRLKLRRRLGVFNSIQREIAEFLVYQAKPIARQPDWPITRVYGFVETEKGLGLLTEKLTGPDGRLAPTLGALVTEKRFTPRHREALKRYFRHLEERHICLNDVGPGNIVFAGNPETDGRFVAIDGLGIRSALPARDWFKSYNAYCTRVSARRIWNYVDASR